MDDQSWSSDLCIWNSYSHCDIFPASTSALLKCGSRWKCKALRPSGAVTFERMNALELPGHEKWSPRFWPSSWHCPSTDTLLLPWKLTSSDVWACANSGPNTRKSKKIMTLVTVLKVSKTWWVEEIKKKQGNKHMYCLNLGSDAAVYAASCTALHFTSADIAENVIRQSKMHVGICSASYLQPAQSSLHLAAIVIMTEHARSDWVRNNLQLARILMDGCLDCRVLFDMLFRGFIVWCVS